MGVHTKTQGRIGQQVQCGFAVFSSFFLAFFCHQLKALEHGMNFPQLVLSSKTFEEPLIFILHILDPSREVLFFRFT